MDPAQLTDRLDIVDVVNRYATALDSQDWDLLDAVFSRDVAANFIGNQLRGLDAVKEMVRGMLGGLGPSQHLIANHRVSLDGDEAGCISAVRAFAAGPGDDRRTYELWGEYRDRLRRLPEGWRIVEREMRVSFEQGARELLGGG